MLRAQAAMEALRWDVAEVLLRDAISQDPQNSEAYALLAVCLINLSRCEEAYDAITVSISLEPDNERYHRIRCAAILDLGNFKLALEEADEAIRLGPEVPWGHHLRAKALHGLNQDQEAIREAKKALSMNPGDEEHMLLIGDLHLEGDPKVAEDWYRQSLALDPCKALAVNNLGVALMKQMRTLEAALAFKSAVLVDPKLKVAKENVRSSVGSYLEIGTISTFGAAVLIVAIMKSGIQIGDSLLDMIGVALLILVLLAIVWMAVGMPYVLRHFRMRKIKKSDPQLLAIFEKVEKDHRAGRIG